MFKSKKDIDSLFGDDEGVAGVVIAICATLYDNGVNVIHVGGLCRLLGVANETAQENDDKVFELPEDIRKNNMSNHDTLIQQMEAYIAENTKFTDKKVKAAATRARAALQEIGKAVKERRKEIIEEKNAI
jgi:ElaB/YqjD/DUF883 family membrane-anchored ribosome-binding protein